MYGDYSGVVADNLPADAWAISMTGTGPLSALGREGPTLLAAAPIVIHQGATATVVVRFRVPGTHGSMTVVPSARLPEEQWSVGERNFTDGTSRTISW